MKKITISEETPIPGTNYILEAGDRVTIKEKEDDLEMIGQALYQNGYLDNPSDAERLYNKGELKFWPDVEEIAYNINLINKRLMLYWDPDFESIEDGDIVEISSTKELNSKKFPPELLYDLEGYVSTLEEFNELNIRKLEEKEADRLMDEYDIDPQVYDPLYLIIWSPREFTLFIENSASGDNYITQLPEKVGKNFFMENTPKRKDILESKISIQSTRDIENFLDQISTFEVPEEVEDLLINYVDAIRELELSSDYSGLVISYEGDEIFPSQAHDQAPMLVRKLQKLEKSGVIKKFIPSSWFSTVIFY